MLRGASRVAARRTADRGRVEYGEVVRPASATPAGTEAGTGRAIPPAGVEPSAPGLGNPGFTRRATRAPRRGYRSRSPSRPGPEVPHPGAVHPPGRSPRRPRTPGRREKKGAPIPLCQGTPRNAPPEGSRAGRRFGLSTEAPSTLASRSPLPNPRQRPLGGPQPRAAIPRRPLRGPFLSKDSSQVPSRGGSAPASAPSRAGGSAPAGPEGP